MTVSEIKQLARDMGYAVVGVRRDNYVYQINDTCNASHEWSADDEIGDYNDEVGMWDGGELNGTCALLPEYLPLLDQYDGDHTYIIAGDEYEQGNDEGEVIIPDAIVIAEL